MNKELIEVRDRILFELNDFMLLRPEIENKILSIVDNNFDKALQKAKEEQPKDVEEFLRSHKIWDKFQDENSGFYGIAPKTIMNLLTDFVNSRKEVTDEEIENETDDFWILDDSDCCGSRVSGFLEGAKWMREQLNK